MLYLLFLRISVFINVKYTSKLNDCYAEPCYTYGRDVRPSVWASVTRLHGIKMTPDRITKSYRLHCMPSHLITSSQVICRVVSPSGNLVRERSFTTWLAIRFVAPHLRGGSGLWRFVPTRKICSRLALTGSETVWVRPTVGCQTDLQQLRRQMFRCRTSKTAEQSSSSSDASWY